MMNVELIQDEFRKKVCQKIELVNEGRNRIRVFSPFYFDDGDQFSIVLKRENDSWILSDEGNTFMHLSYDIKTKDFLSGRRSKIISNTITSFDICENEGELFITIKEERFGDAFFTYIQALQKITDISYLSREVVKSTFYEDFKKLMEESIPKQRLSLEWHHPKLDPKGLHIVDCHINGMDTPYFIFALGNEDKTRDATIAMHQFEKWNLTFESIAIFEEQETINGKVLARLSDICGKLYSNIQTNHERIQKHILKIIEV